MTQVQREFQHRKISCSKAEMRGWEERLKMGRSATEGFQFNRVLSGKTNITEADLVLTLIQYTFRKLFSDQRSSSTLAPSPLFLPRYHCTLTTPPEDLHHNLGAFSELSECFCDSFGSQQGQTESALEQYKK